MADSQTDSLPPVANARAILSLPARTLAPQAVISTDQLFGNAVEIGIDHLGSVYRLRITRQGKLVLNK
ncbi:MAG: hemin uptake protein HemP [Devosia sp.]